MIIVPTIIWTSSWMDIRVVRWHFWSRKKPKRTDHQRVQPLRQNWNNKKWATHHRPFFVDLIFRTNVLIYNGFFFDGKFAAASKGIGQPPDSHDHDNAFKDKNPKRGIFHGG